MAEENKTESKIMINGKELKCLICGSTDFESYGKAMLNTGPFKKPIYVMMHVCKQCGFVHNFNS